MVPSAVEALVTVGSAHCVLGPPQSPHALFSGLLPILSAPCAVVNFSLRHNLRKRRWVELLRTISNLSAYALLEPYTRELRKVLVRSDTTSVLNAIGHDACYKACVYPPSLLPLMNELLLRWEAYWSALKGTMEAQRLLSVFFQSTPPSLDPAAPLENEAALGGSLVIHDEACMEHNLNEGAGNPLLMLPALEKSSLEVLHLAVLIAVYRKYTDEDELQEEI
ncbi:putative protein kinase-like protein [Trypanosoma rangeli]|uniref:Uncharacterized protein n=1 Tax=Trypanosoma rangeli TaxID=5698 RepID=A0A422MWM8_TRYRA|nr:putative protein kinase-like protein [Trypanosoma rangeli]RNE97607.1 putative protein kinase-like protein [Trypanosoma rangeli]|eukprot:RNE97607.1 putative protein kinase-like protein [Trypanosoma rangeli]